METKTAFRARALLAVLPAVFLLVAGCRGKHGAPAVQNEEPEPGARLEASLKMSDPAAPTQLIRGFYGLENNAWRWTRQEFSVVLRPPAEAAQRGAVVKLSFSIPDVVIQKLGSITLSASAAGAKLPPETYSKAGAAAYSADLPASVLAKDSVSIDFALDKSLPAGSVDQRQLGIVATAVGIETK